MNGYKNRYADRECKSVKRKSSLGIICLLVCLAGCAGFASNAVTPTVPMPTNTVSLPPLSNTTVGQRIKVTGKLLEIWQTPNTPIPGATTPSDFEPVMYFLTDDHGDIIVKLKVLDQGKSLVALNNKIITVTGKLTGTAAANGRGQANLNVVEVERVEVPATPPAKSSNKLSNFAAVQHRLPSPYRAVALLCRYAGKSDIPHPVSWYEEVLDSIFPEIDHYWREQSYNQFIFGGSIVRGWYDLPYDEAHYLTPSTSIAQVDDCINIASNDVYFPDYATISVFVNGDIYQVAGLAAIVNKSLNGQPPQRYGYSVFPRQVIMTTIRHELGHTFGSGNGTDVLAHTSGPYNTGDLGADTYDSAWDVMSGLNNCSPSNPISYELPFECTGVGIISYNKDLLQWIPSSQKTVVNNGVVTINLQRLAQPQLTVTPGATPLYLMAQVPLPNGTQFYTVETRAKAGYDVNIPVQAGTPGTVLINRVDPSLFSRQAQVVVVSTRQANVGHACLNGIGPRDTNNPPSMWFPGDTFVDDASGISITINSFDPSTNSFSVTISNGGTPSPTPSFCPTLTPAPTNTPTPSNTPTITPTLTPSPTSTP